MSAATVTGVSAALIVATATAIGALAVVPSAHELRGAADAAAIAAATVAWWGETEPCRAASEVTAAYRVELPQCTCSGSDCTVTTRMWRLGFAIDATARAAAD